MTAYTWELQRSGVCLLMVWLLTYEVGCFGEMVTGSSIMNTVP
jgi:hypothetical protein